MRTSNIAYKALGPGLGSSKCSVNGVFTIISPIPNYIIIIRFIIQVIIR